MLLDTYASLKNINKYKLIPWIIFGLQKSVSGKHKSLTNFINKKYPILKEKFHTNCQKIQKFTLYLYEEK